MPWTVGEHGWLGYPSFDRGATAGGGCCCLGHRRGRGACAPFTGTGTCLRALAAFNGAIDSGARSRTQQTAQDRCPGRRESRGRLRHSNGQDSSFGRWPRRLDQNAGTGVTRDQLPPAARLQRRVAAAGNNPAADPPYQGPRRGTLSRNPRRLDAGPTPAGPSPGRGSFSGSGAKIRGTGAGALARGGRAGLGADRVVDCTTRGVLGISGSVRVEPFCGTLRRRPTTARPSSHHRVMREMRRNQCSYSGGRTTRPGKLEL